MVDKNPTPTERLQRVSDQHDIAMGHAHDIVAAIERSDTEAARASTKALVEWLRSLNNEDREHVTTNALLTAVQLLNRLLRKAR